MENRVQVVQHWKRSFNVSTDEMNRGLYSTRVKAGRDYWVNLEGKIWVCRRGKRWSIGHRCDTNALYPREMRKSRGKNTHMYCCSCGQLGPARDVIEKKANLVLPDLDTIRFLAELDSLNGRNTNLER